MAGLTIVKDRGFAPVSRLTIGIGHLQTAHSAVMSVLSFIDTISSRREIFAQKFQTVQ
jgi:hypothetical protein